MEKGEHEQRRESRETGTRTAATGSIKAPVMIEVQQRKRHQIRAEKHGEVDSKQQHTEKQHVTQKKENKTGEKRGRRFHFKTSQCRTCRVNMLTKRT